MSRATSPIAAIQYLASASAAASGAVGGFIASSRNFTSRPSFDGLANGLGPQPVPPLLRGLCMSINSSTLSPSFLAMAAAISLALSGLPFLISAAIFRIAFWVASAFCACGSLDLLASLGVRGLGKSQTGVVHVLGPALPFRLGLLAGILHPILGPSDFADGGNPVARFLGGVGFLGEAGGHIAGQVADADFD